MTAEQDASYEEIGLLEYFSDLTDPRQLIKVIYPLDGVLVLSLLAGAETFTDVVRFGEKKLDLLRRFRVFVNGTPTTGWARSSRARCRAIPEMLCGLSGG